MIDLKNLAASLGIRYPLDRPAVVDRGLFARDINWDGEDADVQIRFRLGTLLAMVVNVWMQLPHLANIQVNTLALDRETREPVVRSYLARVDGQRVVIERAEASARAEPAEASAQYAQAE